MYYTSFKIFLFFFTLSPFFCSTLGETSFKIGLVRDDYLKYAAQDMELYNGLLYFTRWVNSQGGLRYNNTVRPIEIITRGASTPNSSETAFLVASAYDALAAQGAELFVSPTTTTRTYPTITISEKYRIVNLVISAQREVVYLNTTLSFGTTTPTIQTPPKYLEALVNKGAKTFIIISRMDVTLIVSAQCARDFLTQHGLKMLDWKWMNSTSLDTGVLSQLYRNTFNELVGVKVDIVIVASQSNEYEILVSAMDNIRPTGVKALAYTIGNSPYVQKKLSLGETGDYWVTYTRFDESFNFGVSGEYGGTTKQFFDDFVDYSGSPPTVLEALTPAMLMTWYRAVRICNCIDSETIAYTMRTMSKFETFAFPCKFLDTGNNMYPQAIGIQYVNGMGRPLTAENLVYPIPWTKGPDTGLIIAIALPVAACVLLALAAVAYYIRRQRKHTVKALEQAEEGERRNYKIDYESLTVKTLIGSGGFGYVYSGEYRGAEVAIKKLKTRKMTKSQLDQFARESQVMIGLRHPNILLFMGVCVEPPELCIITEFMSRGSVFDIIRNGKISLPLPAIINMIKDTLLGLQFLHSAGFIHRDIKSPNLLVDKSWRIKIADFGVSCVKKEASENVQISLLWTAPEILEKLEGCYSDKSDIYSVAIVMWELLARRLPYTNMNAAAIIPFVASGRRPNIKPEWDPALVSLMSRCWTPLPKDRPTIIDARNIISTINVDPNFDMSSCVTIEKPGRPLPPPSGHVTFVYSTVAHASKLWMHDWNTMMDSLVMHNELLKSLVDKENGFDVKSNGDSFLFAFSSPVFAVRFCMKAQQVLVKAAWPPKLLEHPLAAEQKDSNGNVCFKGLTLRMGIHTTPAVCEKDTINERYDYNGPGVQIAPKLAQYAPRGSILISSDLYAKVMIEVDTLPPFIIESGGNKVVRPDTEPITVYRIIPQILSGRTEFHDILELGDTDNNGSINININTNINTNTNTNNNISTAAIAKYEFPSPREPWAIQQGELTVGSKIDTGSFGEVRTGQLRGEKVAVKQIVRQKLSDSHILEIRAESAALSILQHKNIVKFKGIFFNIPNISIVTEFMEKGSLSKILTNPANNFTWEQKKNILVDIANGMLYLHCKGIMHREVRSSNMLVGAENEVKVGDFGFARMRIENQTMTQCATVAWTAPEIFDGQNYGSPSDVYSFSIIVWEVIFNKKPWEGMHSMKIASQVTSGKRPPTSNVPPTIPMGLVELMEACWKQEPKERPPFDEIVTKLSAL